MNPRTFGRIVAAGLMAVAAALTTFPAFGYQEVGCRRVCLAKQYAAMRRCQSNCYTTRAAANWYCYHICVGEGH